MKLYATTTSERASKGQGGNKYLDVIITNAEQKTIAFIKIIPKRGFADITISVEQNLVYTGKIFLPKEIKATDWEIRTKGKQKNKCLGYMGCDLDGSYHDNRCPLSPEYKGKQKKDECHKCHSTEKGLTENDNGKLTCDDCWE